MRVTMNADFNRAGQDVAAWSARKQQEIKDVVNTSAINIQGGAKRRARVDTGRLRSSIAVEPATNQNGYALRVGTKVFYAPYVEFGTGVFSEHPTEQGRATPWAFPVPTTGRNAAKYKFKRITVDGKEMFVTKGAKPHPFLNPAAEEERPRFMAAMRGVLRR